jgi:flagellar biosynthesis/type III secretory pathway chaperone
MPEDPNFFAHAFKSQYNLIGLATALGFAVVSASALPLLLAAGLEMVLIPMVAGSVRYRRLIRARVQAERDQKSQAAKQMETSEILAELPDKERVRFRSLEGLARDIRENYKGLDSSSRMLLDDLVQKLEFLLSFYLRMRYSLSRYESYLRSADPDRIQKRIAGLDQEIAKGPERVQQIKVRTKLVLQKRLERYGKALENKQLVEAQTETVEEVLQLLRDQSYSIRDPRSITEQLDGLVSSAEETERGVKDLEQILAAEQDPLLLGGASEELEAEIAAASHVAPADPELEPERHPRELPKQPAASSPPPPPPKKIVH